MISATIALWLVAWQGALLVSLLTGVLPVEKVNDQSTIGSCNDAAYKNFVANQSLYNEVKQQLIGDQLGQ